MSEQEAYLEQYTSELQPLLLQLAQQEGFLRGPLLETADLDELWPALAQPYMANAVPDFEQYPLVSLGWMTFRRYGDWPCCGMKTGSAISRWAVRSIRSFVMHVAGMSWTNMCSKMSSGCSVAQRKLSAIPTWYAAWQSWHLRSSVMRMPSHRAPWHSSSMHVRSSVSIASE